MLSPMDDYPVHQIAEPIRHVATSDRNFYDRYYFNCYPTESPDVFLIVGLGQYPNLGVMDAFAVLRRGDDHIVARMSKALGADRTDTTGRTFAHRSAGRTAEAPRRPRTGQRIRSLLRHHLRRHHPGGGARAQALSSPTRTGHVRHLALPADRNLDRIAHRRTGRSSRSTRRRGGETATARGVCVRSVKPNRNADAPSTESRTSSGSTRSCSSTSSRSR